MPGAPSDQMGPNANGRLISYELTTAIPALATEVQTSVTAPTGKRRFLENALVVDATSASTHSIFAYVDSIYHTLRETTGVGAGTNTIVSSLSTPVDPGDSFVLRVSGGVAADVVVFRVLAREVDL